MRKRKPRQIDWPLPIQAMACLVPFCLIGLLVAASPVPECVIDEPEPLDGAAPVQQLAAAIYAETSTMAAEHPVTRDNTAQGDNQVATQDVPELPDIPMEDDHISILVAECANRDVPLEIAVAVIEHESEFDANAIGPDGRDNGLFQVRQSNFRWLSDELGIADLAEPKDNIRAGVFMLSDLMDSYTDIHMALTAYRWGPTGAREKYWDRGIYESGYSQEILARAAHWASELAKGE